MSSGFNNIQSECSNSCANVNGSRDEKNSLVHSNINVKYKFLDVHFKKLW